MPYRLDIHRAIFYWVLFFTSCFFFFSCDFINPEEEQPAYIHIKPFSLTTNPATQGSSSAKITEAWLFLDNEFLGAYSLPVTIPLLAQGTHTIRLEPGIRDNGIGGTPEIYPFYEIFETTVDLDLVEVDTVQPVTRYRDNATFVFIEEFERSDHLFRDVQVGAPETRINRVREAAFEGDFSGLLNINIEQPEVLIATSRRFDYPDQLVPIVYLEMNYRSEGLAGFGIIGYANDDPNRGEILLSAGFRPSEEWNKIYFNLTRVMANRNFSEFQVVFQAAIPQENGTYITENVRIWLDNIKLIQF